MENINSPDKTTPNSTEVVFPSEVVTQEEVENTAEQRIEDIKHLFDLETIELDNPGSYLKNLTQEAESLGGDGVSVGEEALKKIAQNIDMVGEETSKVINEIKDIVNLEKETEK